MKQNCFFFILKNKYKKFGFILTFFMTHHADTSNFLVIFILLFFANSLLAIMAVRVGSRYAQQCLELEKTIKTVFNSLEYLSLLIF